MDFLISLKLANISISSVQFNSLTQSYPTLCDPMDCSTPDISVHRQLPEFIQTYVHWVGDAIQPSHPLSPPSLPAFNLSQHQGLFQWVSSSHQVAKDWSFSFNISPSNEYPGLISFRMDYLDFLAVQGTLKSLLQHHSSKASILQCSAFFIVQLSHPYMTIGNNVQFHDLYFLFDYRLLSESKLLKFKKFHHLWICINILIDFIDIPSSTF